MKICIDPGHGGNDTGAVGPTGLEEANTVLDISSRISEKLYEVGIDTFMTRTSDVYIELDHRCEMANDWEADYFVSVHLNSNGSSAKGIETLYVSNNGKALAVPIQKAMVSATGDTDRGLKYRDDLYVLNETGMPAVLVEVGFISNPGTESKFKTGEHRELLAEAIVRGIIEFI